MPYGTCSIDDCERKGPLTKTWCGMHYQRWRRLGYLGPAESLIRVDGMYRIPEDAECFLEGCTLPVLAKGWCQRHYHRIRYFGEPGSVEHTYTAHLPMRERILKNVTLDPDTGCWKWKSALFSNGYGHLVVDKKDVLAHRASYTAFVGPIPDGLIIDHVYKRGCRFRSCCNPDHLEPVTYSENNRRRRRVTYLRS